MGQSEVLKLIDKMKFATIKELDNSAELTIRSIKKSLTSLVKFKEVVYTTLGNKRIYISQEYYQEITKDE